MVKKPAEPTYTSAQLNFDQITRAVPRLQKRVDELKAIDFSRMQQRGDPAVKAARVSIEQTLEEIFGAHSTEYRRYSPAATLSSGPVSMAFRGEREDFQFRDYYARSRDGAVALLEQAIKALIERQEELRVASLTPSSLHVEEPARGFSQRVFVVHGRDGGHRESVARFLHQIGLEPVILHEEANKGRTLITKFSEVAADIGFAVVLMTADDVGGLREAVEHRPRARQNVIFELGFFIGALGPDRVAALVEQDVERPSDFDGVVYIAIEQDWRLPLCKELRAAGYVIDLNKAF